MADLSEAQLRAGLERSKSFTGYFSTPAFRELCNVTAADLGLPEVHAAYVEACNYRGPTDRHQWSHAAVYLAAVETGWFELRNRPEKDIFPLFKRNYEVMVQRVLAGEELKTPVQKALPPKSFIPARQEKAQEAMSKIRGLLS